MARHARSGANSTTMDWLGGVGQSFGDFWIFAAKTVGQVSLNWWRWRNWRLLAPQLFEVGTRSIPVVLITGLFVGMVLAVQAYDQFAAAGLSDTLGVVVNISVVRELGPVLAGVVLAGRIGSALSAELGTMRVTEQIDAVRAMGADPIRFLVAPRFLACALLIPFLTIYCDIMGVLGGYFISVLVYRVNAVEYWRHSANAIMNWDIITGLTKSVFFGAAIALISCFKGFNCRPGAEGVGRAATESFVSSFVAILILDFFLAILMQAISVRIWGFRPIF